SLRDSPAPSQLPQGFSSPCPAPSGILQPLPSSLRDSPAPLCSSCAHPELPWARAGLLSAIEALPVPPRRRGGLVEQSPGVTSHLPSAAAEGERSRLL
ncbi:unnamed protein product, partial [Coccothraustes coccothraustes]